jgi:hypothetical protein
VWTSAWARIERRRFGSRIETTPIHPPLIILGHWRSGTSLVLRLLALDHQFAYPQMFQTHHPHTFLTTASWLTPLTASLLPRTRVADEMAVGWRLPAEDELALANLTGLSFRIGRIFPRRTRHYDRFLTLRGCEPAEVETWMGALRGFVRKLTWKYRRPLLLKSPPHTARIALLLRVFPDARFVHVRRDPYAVFQSTCQELGRAAPFSRVQAHDEPDLTGLVIERYRTLYGAFVEQRALIPEGRLHEVTFEALERDPVTEIRAIYAGLGLAGFEAVAPRLAAVAEASKGYRKTRPEPLPETLRRRIVQAWGPSFEAWGYRS